jgi:hypothetical protein
MSDGRTTLSHAFDLASGAKEMGKPALEIPEFAVIAAWHLRNDKD